MKPKPAHLGPQYAAQFKDQSIVDAYHTRPPYPTEVFQTLIELITDQPRAVLDIGCGTGDLARRLVNDVERVDAVDFSSAMLMRGKQLPGGDHPRLNWINGRVEDVTLQPPYALITAGESLHWMDWEVVFPLFQRILTPNGYLTLVDRGAAFLPWQNELRALISHFATNREYRPYDLIEELEQRHLFQKQGTGRTQPVPFTQSTEAYIEHIHSQNGFSRERMGEVAAGAFDAEVRKILAPFTPDGQFTFSIVARLTWGKPVSPG